MKLEDLREDFEAFHKFDSKLSKIIMEESIKMNDNSADSYISSTRTIRRCLEIRDHMKGLTDKIFTMVGNYND